MEIFNDYNKLQMVNIPDCQKILKHLLGVCNKSLETPAVTLNA